MDRLGIYQYILSNLEDTYKRKNSDYGNSVADTYEKFGCASFLVRITDKYNRLMTLCDPNAPQQMVKDEKIDDTILDLANYCLLWLVEREYAGQQLKQNDPQTEVNVQPNKPVSNYSNINKVVTDNIQKRLAKLDEDDFKAVLNLLEAYNIRYELRPNGIKGDKVKLILVVDDTIMLQKIMDNLGL